MRLLLRILVKLDDAFSLGIVGEELRQRLNFEEAKQ